MIPIKQDLTKKDSRRHDDDEEVFLFWLDFILVDSIRFGKERNCVYYNCRCMRLEIIEYVLRSRLVQVRVVRVVG